jgi:LmbE family N-acetylglucosaminyl deacetylase
MDRLLVLSPHLDDAVFACGEVIASRPGATVATLFAGGPRPPVELTQWDREAGFEAGDDVIGTRRAEDRAALDLLGANALWLDFPDDQYGNPPAEEQVTAVVCDLIEETRPNMVLFPAGLFHADHRRAHDAALKAMARVSAPEWCLYEDTFYRRIDGLLIERLSLLRSMGWVPEAARLDVGPDAHERKRRAVARYRSQMKALSTRRNHGDVLKAEGFWRLPGGGQVR